MSFILFASSILLPVVSGQTGLGGYIASGLGINGSSSTASSGTSSLASTDPVTTLLVTSAGDVIANVTGLANGDVRAAGTTFDSAQLEQADSTISTQFSSFSNSSSLVSIATSHPATTNDTISSLPTHVGSAAVGTGAASSSSRNSTNGTSIGITTINACWLSSQSWLDASYYYASNTALYSTWVTTTMVGYDYFGSYFNHFDNNHTTTLCDKILRPMGSVEFIPNVRFGSTLTSYTTSGVDYTVASPSCTIDPDECATLVNQYYAHVSVEATLTASETVPAVIDLPQCNLTGAKLCPDNCVLDAYGGVAQLWFWPEDDVPSLNCSAPLESLPNAGATAASDYWTTVQGQKRDVGIYSNVTVSPRVWSSGTITLTSPTIAMYFESLSRTDGCGRTLDNYIVTMHPSEASSIRGYNDYREYYPFHFQDLNTKCVDEQGCYAEVSLDAYIGQRTCAGDLGINPKCFTIWNDYNPALYIPSRISSATAVAPEWGSSCIPINIWGAWDPPRALRPAESEAGVSTPNAASTTSSFVAASTSASPASSPDSPATSTPPASPQAETQVSSASGQNSEEASPTSTPNGRGAQTSNNADPQSAASASANNAASSQAGQQVDSDPGTAISGQQTAAQSSTSQASQEGSDPGNAAASGIVPAIISAADGTTQQEEPDPAVGATSVQAPAAQSTEQGNAAASSILPAIISAAGSTTQQGGSDPDEGATSAQTPAAPATGQGDPASSDPGASAVVATVGSQTLTFVHGSNVVVGTNTLSAGGAAATLSDGHVVSAASQGIVVDGTTHAIADTASLDPAVAATVGSQTITATSGSKVVVGSQTVSVGGAAVIVSGQTLSLATNGIVVDGTTQAFTNPAAGGTGNNGNGASDPTAVATAGGQTISATAGSPVVIAGSTLSAGGLAATLSGGQVVSVASNGLEVDGSTQSFTTETDSTAVVTAGGQTISATTGSPVIVGGSTLSAGGPAATLSGGQVISMAPNGLVVDGSTHSFVAEPPAGSAFHGSGLASSGVVVTLAGQTYTAIQSDGSLILGTNTLVPGQVATISGVVVSDAYSELVVAGQTVAVSSLPAAPSPTASGSLVTVGSEVFTVLPAGSGGLEVEDSSTTATLSIGGSAISVAGLSLSAGTGGLVIASGTSSSTIDVTATHSESSGIQPSVISSASATDSNSPNRNASNGRLCIRKGLMLILTFMLLMFVV